MGDLAADTALKARTGGTALHLSRDWEIWGPNGGYLAVIALRAAGADTPLRRPATFSCHYLGVADFGAVDLDVRTIRGSRRAASVAVSMTQGGKPILEAQAWIVGDVDGLEHDAAPMPAVAPPDELPNVDELMTGEERGPYHALEQLRGATASWLRRSDWEARGAGRPELSIVVSLRSARDTFDDSFVDAGRALLLVDTLGWPAAVRGTRATCPCTRGPSLDVTARFHARVPETPWLLAECSSPVRATVWWQARRPCGPPAGSSLRAAASRCSAGRRTCSKVEQPADRLPMSSSQFCHGM